MKGFGAKITICLLVMMALLPLRVLYLLSDLAYVVIYYLWRYRREIVKKNLRSSFPDYSDKELIVIERQFYHHFCDLMAEELKMLNMSDKERRRRIIVKGTELYEQAVSESNPIFVFGAHIGNWEWTPEISSRVTHPRVRAGIYQPPRNSFSDSVMLRMRERIYPGVIMIPQNKTALTLIRLKEKYGCYQFWLNSDQCPIRSGVKYWTSFLNQDTPYIAGGEAIGRKVNAIFLFAHVTKTRRGYYELTLREVRPTAEELANKDGNPYSLAYMRMLEENIREQPEIYLWTHNRWKYRREINADGTWKVIDTRKLR